VNNNLVVPRDADGFLQAPTSLVADAHDAVEERRERDAQHQRRDEGAGDRLQERVPVDQHRMGRRSHRRLHLRRISIERTAAPAQRKGRQHGR